jgi:hypothetical protein
LGLTQNVKLYTEDSLPIKSELNIGSLGIIVIFIKSREIIEQEAVEAKKRAHEAERKKQRELAAMALAKAEADARAEAFARAETKAKAELLARIQALAVAKAKAQAEAIAKAEEEVRIANRKMRIATAKKLRDAAIAKAEMIAKQLSIPVYGIGGGDGVDGQLVIFHDLTGLFWEFKSKFVKRYCEAGKIIQDALEQYVDEVKSGAFPSQENFYEIKEDELEKLLGDDKWKYEKDRVENHASPNHSVTPITTRKK